MSSLFGISANGADASFYNGVATQSLRFDDGSSAYLTRTPSSAGNRLKWTWSGWFKRTTNATASILMAGTQGSNDGQIYFTTNTLRILNRASSSINTMKDNSALYRDSSAWYHVVVIWDTAQSDADDRVREYVNGKRITAFGSNTIPSQNTTSILNNNVEHRIGAVTNNSSYFDGYMAEVNFLDGYTVSETDGYLDELGEVKNGVWIAKEYTGSYGTNGYRLQFNQTGTGTASASTIGADTSGNTNHWTSSGIVAYDCSLLDSPENNFPVLNPLVVSNNTNANTFAEGNIEGTTGNNAGGNITGSMAIPSSGKWYFEFRPMAVGNGVFIGLWNPVANQQFSFSTTPVILYVSYNGGLRLNGTSPSYGATYSAADTIGVAVDVDNGTVTFYKNNASQGATNFDASGLFPVITDWYTSTNIRVRVNFGQDSTFSDARLGGGATSDTGHDYSAYISATTFRVNSGWNNAGGAPASGMPAVGDTVQFRNTSNQIVGSSSGGTDFIVTAITQQGSSGGAVNNAIVTLNRSILSHSPALDGGSSILAVAAGSVFTNNAADSNGIGDFVYTPPSGHLALCSANLPELTVGPNSATQADNNFTPYIWTGNDTNPRAFTDVGLQADWIWIKKRSGSGTSHHLVADSTRGDGKTMLMNASNQEATNDGNGTVSDTTTAGGFTVDAGSTSDEMVNDGSDTYVAWLWKANGGTTSSNTDGSITSTVQANTDAGFSIVSYTGTGANATVGHGLGVAPKMIIMKRRDADVNWVVYHEEIGNDREILLNSTGAQTGSNSVYFNNTSPTSTVFSLGSDNYANASSGTYVAYCFAEIEGYSKFGSYIGNANADGPFVYLGFRPAFIMTKNYSSAGGSWGMYDNTRNSSNDAGTLMLRANGSDLDYYHATYTPIDFLSNGFKIRNTGGEDNAAQSFIYMAFAEAPFKYANAR